MSSGSWISTTCVFSSWRFLYLSVPCGTSELCDFENPWATRLQVLHVLRHCRTKPTWDRMDQRLRLCDQKRINVDLSCLMTCTHSLTHVPTHTRSRYITPPPLTRVWTSSPVAQPLVVFPSSIKELNLILASKETVVRKSRIWTPALKFI